MKLLSYFLIAVSLFLVQAQYLPYYDGSLYQYPDYPITDGRNPNYGYDNRLFYRTSTTTATTTTTTTCTVSTGFVCLAGRRRRFLEEDVSDAIEPSPVNK